MRAVEDASFTKEKPSSYYMEKAGKAVSGLAFRIAAGRPILILCGPGNNGGDGYVAARHLQSLGSKVRVVAVAEPKSDGSKWASERWVGPVEQLTARTKIAPVVIDAIFGTGARGGLDPAWEAHALRLFGAADAVIAVDIPSALNSDEPTIMSPYDATTTLALGALRPAHLLQPSASACGAILLNNLEFECKSDSQVIVKPGINSPAQSAHKYSRGMVAVISGSMPGAAALAIQAAVRAGAGYGLVLTEDGRLDIPHAIVQRSLAEIDTTLSDRRLSSVVIGPGLGRFARAQTMIDKCIASGKPLVIDGDALHLLNPDEPFQRPVILTPHAGEFDALFGKDAGHKIERTRAAAIKINAVVIFKGADTVIAAPNGQVRVATGGPPWLASAGTGDVLAGLCGAMLAQYPDDVMTAAEAAVWLHREAGRLAGPALIADDLIDQLPNAMQRALV